MDPFCKPAPLKQQLSSRSERYMRAQRSEHDIRSVDVPPFALNAAKLSDFRRVYRRAAAKKKAVGVRDSWDTSAGSRRHTSHGRTPLGLHWVSGSSERVRGSSHVDIACGLLPVCMRAGKKLAEIGEQ